jgi:hypothetical protein
MDHGQIRRVRGRVSMSRQWLRWMGVASGIVLGLSLVHSPMVFAAKVGERVVGGMRIVVELEKPAMMRMLMQGMWMMRKPETGVTHHFEVVLEDPEFGGRIPYARVSAAFENLRTKSRFTKRLDPMYGEKLHYGADVRLARATYKVLVTVRPPTMMRMEAALNKWLQPVQAEFTFDVK